VRLKPKMMHYLCKMFTLFKIIFFCLSVADILVETSFISIGDFCNGLPIGQYCNPFMPRQTIYCPASVGILCPLKHHCEEGIITSDGNYTASW
jgi:hypothetical protein